MMDETLVFKRTGTAEDIRQFYEPLNSVNSTEWNGKPAGTVRFVHMEADRLLHNFTIETMFLYRPEGWNKILWNGAWLDSGSYASADWSGLDFGEQVKE